MKNNKEVSSAHNDEVHPHREGQQQNTSSGNAGENHSREVQEMNEEREDVSNTTETESDRASRNEDEGIRGGKSSV